jgi:flagellar basal body-associated protein FliL
MTKKKLIIILVVILAGGGYAAKKFLLAPPPPPKPKIAGEIYGLPKQFTLNMADGRYATLTVALVLGLTQSDGASAAAAATSPDGFGTLPEEPAIRAIITSAITDDNANVLLTTAGRTKLQASILASIAKETDVKVTGLMFTDVAVQ